MGDAILPRLTARLRPIPDAPPQEPTLRWRAAVAVVLREREGATEVLVIRRAVRAGDRWSGDAALPGGKVSEGDRTLADTAAREAFEEVGLDLAGIAPLGALPDHPRRFWRRWERIAVTPVVWRIEGDPALSLNEAEVAEARWVPLDALRTQRERFWFWWSPRRVRPLAVPFLLPRARIGALLIWGLTHSILEDLQHAAREA